MGYCTVNSIYKYPRVFLSIKFLEYLTKLVYGL